MRSRMLTTVVAVPATATTRSSDDLQHVLHEEGATARVAAALLEAALGPVETHGVLMTLVAVDLEHPEAPVPALERVELRLSPLGGRTIAPSGCCHSRLLQLVRFTSMPRGMA